MLRKTLKIASIAFGFTLALLLILLFSINTIINSHWFRNLLNEKLKEHKITVNYQRVYFSPFKGNILIEGLDFRYSKSTKLSLKELSVKNLYKTKELEISLSDGDVWLSLAKKRHAKKGKGTFAIPIIPQINVKNLTVHLYETPITIKECLITKNREGSILISSPVANLTGKAVWDNNAISISLSHLTANASRLKELLEKIGVHAKLPVLNSKAKVRIEKAEVEFNLKKKVLQVKIPDEVEIETPSKTFVINGNSPIKALTNIAYEFSRHQLKVKVKEARGSLPELKRIILLFTKAHVLTHTVYPIIASGHLRSGSFSITLKKGKAKGILLDAFFDKVTANIPKTKLTVHEAKGHIHLEGKKINIQVEKAKAEGAEIQGTTTIELQKPIAIDVKLEAKGKVNSIYRILNGLPLKKNLLTTLKQHRCVAGAFKANVRLTIHHGVTLTAKATVNEGIVEDALFPKRTVFQKAYILIDKNGIKITSYKVKYPGASVKRAVLNIANKEIKVVLFGLNAQANKLNIPILAKPLTKAGVQLKEGNLWVKKLSFKIQKGKLKDLRLSGRASRIRCLYKKTDLFIKRADISVKTPLILVRNAALKVDGIGLKLSQLTYNIETNRVKVTGSCPEPYKLVPWIEAKLKKHLPLEISKGSTLSVNLTGNIKRKIFTVKDAILKNERAKITANATIAPQRTSLQVAVDTGKLIKVDVTKTKQELSLKARGSLNLGAFKALLIPTDKRLQATSGSLNADLSTMINISTGVPYQYKGFLSFKNFRYNGYSINGKITGNNSTINLDPITFKSKEGTAHITGIVILPYGSQKYTEGKLLFALNVTGKYLNLTPFLPQKGGKKKRKKLIPAEGNVHFTIEKLHVKRWDFTHVKGSIYLNTPSHIIAAKIKNAELCKFKFTGKYTKTGTSQHITINSEGKNSFEKLFKCVLAKKQQDISGNFTYKLQLQAEARGEEDPLRHLNGKLTLLSNQGRIYRLTLLMKILQILSISNILTLNFPDIQKKGFPYRKLLIEAEMQKDTVKIEKGILDSSALRLYSYGKIYPFSSKINLTILAAPFTTLDKILSSIPLIGKILTGESKTFISFPLRVTGDLKNPSVIPLSPLSIGKGILNVFKRIIKTPTYLIPANAKEGSKKPTGK